MVFNGALSQTKQQQNQSKTIETQIRFDDSRYWVVFLVAVTHHLKKPEK